MMAWACRLTLVAMLCGVVWLVSGCSSDVPVGPSGKIRIDQCGYLPRHSKMAYVTCKARNFKILGSNGNVMYSGKVSGAQYWAEAGDTVRRIDFSDFDVVGRFTIVVDDTIRSLPVNIGHLVYAPLAESTVKAFYYNRCGIDIDELHGGVWHRKAGHPDTKILIHRSAQSLSRPAGTRVSCPGGWYQTGDYNQYVVPSCVATYTLLLASNMYGKQSVQTDLNIPESGNCIPDIQDEALYNIRWMLSMQDPEDGGVYHKLTTLVYEDYILPSECLRPRYLMGKSTAATLDFAAVMAYTSRVLDKSDDVLARLASQCRKASVKAYKWALANRDVVFHNAPEDETGEYSDDDLSDEWFWASTEMWLSTGDVDYKRMALSAKVSHGVQTWQNVSFLAYYSLVTGVNGIEGISPTDTLMSMADRLVNAEKVSAVSLSERDFGWGSNASVANVGMLKMVAYYLTKNVKYYESGLNDLHYLLGRNAVGRSFVTGTGVYSPMNIHHRISVSDEVAEPVPGLLCGGPTVECLPVSGKVQGRYPAKAYCDSLSSYMSNGVSLDWNAPLVFLIWGIEE